MNDRQKNRYRRVIRVLMIVVAAVLLLIGVAVPMINNAIAYGIEKDLRALPLPDGAQLIVSGSAAQRYSDTGNGIEYLGALLLRTDMTREELAAFYAPYVTALETCTVVPADGRQVLGREVFSAKAEGAGDGCFVVYTLKSASGLPLRSLLETDIRGH